MILLAPWATRKIVNLTSPISGIPDDQICQPSLIGLTFLSTRMTSHEVESAWVSLGSGTVWGASPAYSWVGRGTAV